MLINEIDEMFRSQLNEAQWEAVRYCDGPSLVIAGAGSGKTRVLTYKIAYLLKKGMLPWQIMALTFTNKAAREMTQRIADIVGDATTRQVWCGTFHSIFARMLRIEAAAIDFRPDFTIYDTSDARSLLKTIVKELGLDEKVYKPALVLGRISEAKNLLFTSSRYAADRLMLERDKRDNVGEIHRIYHIYQQRLHLSNAMDFDDLLLNTFLLFEQFPEIRQKYAERFQYILVDEYQDTNLAQHRIISQLTDAHSRICVVGDDAQSIYGFRGANIDNILHFTQQYAQARTIKLERNYRSTQTIVEAANSIIRHNQHQIPKTVYSEKECGEPLHLFSAYSDNEESMKISGEIRRLHVQHDVPYSDMALLYRTNAQSRVFEETFRSVGIPYRIYGGLSFYQRKEIKDVLAYFRLITNFNDEEAFKRIINYPARGIGKTTTDKLQLAAAEHTASLWDVSGCPAAYQLSFNKGTLSKLDAFRQMILLFREQQANTSAYALAAEVIRVSGIGADVYADKSPENLSRQENLQELLNSIKTFETDQMETHGTAMVSLSDYLSQVSLLSDTETEEDEGESVTLMTVHAAKGLEFDTVFITGLEDDLFPNANARYSQREMEEERRLFYVAVTRAKTRCYLSYAKSRMKYGMIEPANPSPFLKDIGRKYLSTDEGRSNYSSGASFASRNTSSSFARTSVSHSTSSYSTSSAYSSVTKRKLSPLPQKPQPSMREMNKTTSPVNSQDKLYQSVGLSPGNVIEHMRFGIGVVNSIEGTQDNALAVVSFENVGTKKLLLKFVKYKLIK